MIEAALWGGRCEILVIKLDGLVGVGGEGGLALSTWNGFPLASVYTGILVVS